MKFISAYIVKVRKVMARIKNMKTYFSKYNFGFASVLHYVEETTDLFYLIDGFECIDPNPVYEGGMLIRALGSVIAIHLTRENADFAIQIIEDSEVYGSSKIQFLILPTGEDLLIFLGSLREQIANPL